MSLLDEQHQLTKTVNVSDNDNMWNNNSAILPISVFHIQLTSYPGF